MTEQQQKFIEQALIDAAGIIDVVKQEWCREGAWSEWDAEVRQRITRSLEILTQQITNPAK